MSNKHHQKAGIETTQFGAFFQHFVLPGRQVDYHHLYDGAHRTHLMLTFALVFILTFPMDKKLIFRIYAYCTETNTGPHRSCHL